MAAPTMFLLAELCLAARAGKINFKRKLKIKEKTNSLVRKKQNPKNKKAKKQAPTFVDALFFSPE